MLQTSGSAYYHDADALNSIKLNSIQDSGQISMFGKFGSLFGKSKDSENKNLKNND